MYPLIEFDCHSEEFFSANDYNMTPELLERLAIIKNELLKTQTRLNESNLLLEIKELNCFYCTSYLAARLGHTVDKGITQINRNNLLELMHSDYRAHFIHKEKEFYEILRNCTLEEREKIRAFFLLKLKETDGHYYYYLMNERLFFCCAEHTPCLMLVNVKRLMPDYKPNDEFFFLCLFKSLNSIEMLKSKYKLTDREQDVVLYALMGYTLKQTAGEMKIAINTVRNERHNAYTKMSIHDVASIETLI